MAKVKLLGEAEITKLADEADKAITSAKKSAATASKAIDALIDGGDERFTSELKDYAKREAKHLVMRTARFKLRLQRVTNLNNKFRNRAFERRAVEMQMLYVAARSVLKYNNKLQKQTDEEFYKAIHGGESEGAVTEDEFLAFFDSADFKVQDIKEEDPGEDKTQEATDKEPAATEGEDGESTEKKTEESSATKEENGDAEANVDTKSEVKPVCLSKDELARVFSLVKDEPDCISKESFLRMVRTYMKVVKDTALTTGFEIQDSKTVRKLDKNEILEILEAAKVEPSVKVKRLKALASKDGKEGWVTVEGNQGTAFLQECEGRVYKVVKAVELTDEVELADKEDDDSATRKLKVGELFEGL